LGVKVIGTGAALGETVVSSPHLEDKLGLAEGFIESKTGIRERRVASSAQSPSVLCGEAARKALARAGMDPSDLDLVICCTFIGEYVFPSFAHKIMGDLGAINAFGYDLSANCNGLQVALRQADCEIRSSPRVRNVLIVGNGRQSEYINWDDSSTCIYFGDGCSAVLLSRCEDSNSGFLAHETISDCRAYESVRYIGNLGASRREVASTKNDYYELVGLDVWKQAVRMQPSVVRRCLASANQTISEVDFFIWHQANKNLIEFMMHRLDIPLEKTIINVDRLGNTADASMGIVLDQAIDEDRISRGDLVLVSGVGAGFIAGASLMRY